MRCMLDYFPWEILHTIFDFLKTIDLLHAFIQINPHLDTVLHSYLRIQLNFKSIKKSTFYFICEHIHSNQVQSLVLSNDEYTPGQTKLFMSLLPLIQFSNLQYLSIDQLYDANLLCMMLSHLENHVQIRSLSVTGPQIQISKTKSRSITEILTTLPSLKRLTFMDSSPLITLRQPLFKLTHLTISSCVLNDLKIIFHRVPNLLYLKISMPFNNNTTMFDYVPPHLSSLMIESKKWTLFNELENFLSLTPSLKRLVLETMGEQDLINGRLWQTLIKTKLPHLKELALNITPEENNMTGDDVLTLFQNPFWTIEKHWRFACLISSTTQSCARLFSIPHFAPTDDWYPPNEGFFNYSLTPYSFNENCTELRVCQFPPQVLISSPFKRIHTLSLECTTVTNDIEQLQKIVNLLSVNHLKFGPCGRLIPFDDLLQVAPNISQLTMDNRTLTKIMDSLPNDQNVYEQIKRLNVKNAILNTDVDRICRIFPKLEYVVLSVKEQEYIPRIFSGLHYLTSATVYWTHPFKISPLVMDEYLQQNNICTDGTYQLLASSLHVWID